MNRLRGVLVGGAIAGILDITYAITWSHFRGRSAMWVLQSVASGLLGETAFHGGVPLALLGLFCHFIVAFGAATVYYVAATKLAILRDRPILSGAIFGIFVYLFMNFVVIPLSAFPIALKFPPAVLARGFVSHAVLIGIPIAMAISRLSFGRRPSVNAPASTMA